IGYETAGGFYVKDLLNKQCVLITSDQHLLHPIKDLKHEDTYEVFFCHVLYEPLLDTEGPTVDDLGGEVEVVNLVGESVDVNLGEEGEVVDLDGDGEVVNLGGEGVDVNLGEEGVDDNLGGESESDFLSSDLDVGDIPSEGGSDIDEEGVDIPARRRSKKVRYDEDCEVSIFELGMVFEGATQFKKAVSNYGLVFILLELSPNADRRMCARHIWSNWHMTWRGEERRK
ncbi:hypothetical protein H5410_020670, partial [Solanum commersonii]